MDRRPWFARPPCIRPDEPERRRATVMQCSPLPVIFAVLLLAAAYIGVPAALSARSQILAVLRDVAAVALILAAAGLALAMTRRLAVHAGQHTDVLPGDEPEPGPVTRKPAVPAEPAEPGTYTWRIRPADAAAMTAGADAFAAGGTGIEVSEDGTVYELAGAGEDDDA